MAMLISGLASLRAEFDKVNPHRDHSSDGWIGDDAHAARTSDHNPDANGVVHAIDVDKDGVPMAAIVAFIVARCKAGTERRLQYVIFRRTIWSRSWGWTARRYTGVNPHLEHAHFSALHSDLAGHTEPWGVAERFTPHAPASAPAPRPPAGSAAALAHPKGSRELSHRKPALEGADVEFVQRFIGKARCGPADGAYGPKTAAGVRWYQYMRSLAVDGKVGPVTWRNMGVRWTGGTS